MRIGRVISRRHVTLLLVTLIAATVGVGSTGTAHARTAGPGLFWRWSDGVDTIARTFDAGRYPSPAQLPRLTVATDPATAGQLVALQFEAGGHWLTDDRARTDGSGTATLELNPYCENGAWCNRTYPYRLMVNGQQAGFTITFAN